MSDLDTELNERLAGFRAEGLFRELRRIDSAQSPRILSGGKALLNFSSNDYLGLADDPVLKAAAIQAIERYGAGAGASRLISSPAPHHELEEAIAAFKATEAALSFSSGYATALGTICALLGKQDVIIIDKLAHACLVDAARLCGAKLRAFAHNDLDDLESILKWAQKRSRITSTLRSAATEDGHHASRILIVTESVFSMDGDLAPLREIVELKEKYGAWLMVDEAHATGLYGPNRRGVAEDLGVSDSIEIQMGTLGKALGASGGYICGSRALIDYLVNRARTFIFSTAPGPAAAAAATAGVQFVRSQAGNLRRNVLWTRVGELNSKLGAIRNVRSPSTVAPHPDPLPIRWGEGEALSKLPSAIIPILIGDEREAVSTATRLRDQDIFLPAVRYPAVPRGQARLRLTVTAAHTPADIATLTNALKAIRQAPSTAHHVLPLAVPTPP